MRDYVINEELLCFTQDTIEKDNILVIEIFDKCYKFLL